MSAATVLPISKLVEKAFLRVYKVVGEPWRLASRGRKPLRLPSQYALALFVRSFYGWSYRTSAAVLKVPRSCLAWAFKRLRVAWVRALVERAAACLRRQYVVKCSILDSTGVSLQPRGCKRLFYRPYWKLHALVEYAPWAHKLWFSCAIATTGHRNDSPQGERLLASTGAPPPTLLLADKGYDSASLYKLAYNKGWRVCMRQRQCASLRKQVRKRVWHEYYDKHYRKYLGRIEAAFGGFANRYASRIGERLASTRGRACLLWAAAHNIRTLAKTITQTIYWTLSG